MALLGLKMALIHPKKVQIGYKLDQNTNLVNTFENNRRKCKKVKIQWNMKDFHWKISIRCWKSRFVKNHEKRKNSLPDCPIWLIFGYVGLYHSTCFEVEISIQPLQESVYSFEGTFPHWFFFTLFLSIERLHLENSWAVNQSTWRPEMCKN